MPQLGCQLRGGPNLLAYLARILTISVSLPRSESTISRPTTIEVKSRHTTIISNDALLEQWHQLTSYIVSLEKEVQCYKQLIEECQQAQTVHTNGNSDTHLVLHPENSEEETASKTRARKQSSVPDQQYWDKLIEGTFYFVLHWHNLRYE